METLDRSADVVMLGTFSAWNLGTIQARALPLASELRALGIRPVIVVTPWDMPGESGAMDVIDGVPLLNTQAVSARMPVMAIAQQIRWVHRLSPAVIHVFKPKGFGGSAGRLLSRSLPVVVDSDDWEGDGGWNDIAGYSAVQRRVFNLQEQDLLKRADYVIAASTVLERRARLMRNGADSTVVRVPNGLTLQRWTDLSTARTLAPSAIDPATILLYSRFAEFQPDWLARYVQALARLTVRPVTVRVIGHAENQTLPRFENSLVNVNMLGYVPFDRLPELLASSSLAVYPYEDSRVTRSKQSVKLLEQMAAGCPLIASDVGDIALTLGNAGVVLPKSTPESFARTSIKLLCQPRRLDTMSAAGTERIRSEFLFSNLAQNVLDIYRRAGLDK